MRILRLTEKACETYLVEPVLRGIEKGKPYLGICLGLQILFSVGEEFGIHRGLDVIKGKVVRFKPDPEYKVPHMGWNTVEILREAPALQGIQSDDFFYFVHSYDVVPEEKNSVATLTTYCLKYLERKPLRDSVPSGEKPGERAKGVGKLR